MSWPLILQFALCPVVLVSLLWTTAPYGRHFRQGWGPSLPNRLAWILMELPALLTIVFVTVATPAGRSAPAVVPLLFWCGHYAYRTFLFPALMRPSNRTFPMVLVLFAVGFNLLNGFNNGLALQDNAALGGPLVTPHFLAGAGIFILGFVMHVQADAAIRALRSPGETGYRIPQGGLFR